jgi:general secretion pathway protein K
MPPGAVCDRQGTAVPARQCGVALAVVVWFLAAMSVLVAGIVYQARMDTRLTRLQVSQARALALADGAIQLALADMMRIEREGESISRGTRTGVYTLAGTKVTVGFTPVIGLVDLNMATEELLVALFAYGADTGEKVAEELALNMIEWRSPTAGGRNDSARGPGFSELRHGRFEAVEDLMLVPGIGRNIFESIRDSVYVAQQGQAGVDWSSAPASVLAILSGGDRDRARELVSERTGDAEPMVPPADLDLSFQQQQGSSLYRVDALVQFDQDSFVRRRWVDRRRQGGDGLPWSFVRSEAVQSLNDEQRKKLVGLEYADAGN